MQEVIILLTYLYKSGHTVTFPVSDVKLEKDGGTPVKISISLEDTPTLREYLMQNPLTPKIYACNFDEIADIYWSQSLILQDGKFIPYIEDKED